MPARAGFPAALSPLDVPGSQFPGAVLRFMESADGRKLSLNASFFLLGMCRTHLLPFGGDPGKHSEDSREWDRAVRMVRAHAWKMAGASPRAAVEAIAAVREPTRQPPLPENLHTKDPRIFSVPLVRDYAPVCAGSEAREWLQLLDLAAAVRKAAELRPKLEWTAPPKLRDDLIAGLPADSRTALVRFSAIAAPCFAAHPMRRPSRMDDLEFTDENWEVVSGALLGGGAKAAEIYEKHRRSMRPSCGLCVFPEIPQLVELPVLTNMLTARRWQEAAGYALLMDAASNSSEGEGRTLQLRAELLQALVPDWELAALGGKVLSQVLNVRLENFGAIPGDTPRWPAAVLSDKAVPSYLSYLEGQGKGVRSPSEDELLPLLDWMRIDAADCIVRLSLRPRPLSAEHYRLAAAQLAALHRPTPSIVPAKRALAVLALIDTPECRAMLREYLPHRSPTVANLAAAALRKMGESVPDRPLVPPLSVGFTVDGAPLRFREASWHLQTLTEQGECNMGGGGVLQIDGEGKAAMPHDLLLQHEGGSRNMWMVFVVKGATKGTGTSVTNGAHLAFATPWPPPWDKPIQFTALTCEPQVMLSPPQGAKFPKPLRVNVRLLRPPQDGAGRLPAPGEEISVTASKFKIPTMQAGKWELHIKVAGFAGFREIVELRPGAPLVEVRLEPGTQVKAGVPTAIADSFGRSRALELFRNGRKLEPDWDQSSSEEARLYPLPPGHYRLRLRSSEEITKGWGDLRLRYPRFEAVEKEFTITAGTGPMLDLGMFSVNVLPPQ